jgi:hypothetical protein
VAVILVFFGMRYVKPGNGGSNANPYEHMPPGMTRPMGSGGMGSGGQVNQGPRGSMGAPSGGAQGTSPNPGAASGQ